MTKTFKKAVTSDDDGNRIQFDVYLEWKKIFAMAVLAAKSKGQQSTDGPLKVQIVKVTKSKEKI
jgi:hypothetical protein